MPNLGTTIAEMVGRPKLASLLRGNDWRLLLHGGWCALKALAVPQRCISGPALIGRGNDLFLSTNIGTRSILASLMRKEPVISLRNGEFARLIERIGLDLSDNYRAVVSHNGKLILFGSFQGKLAVSHVITDDICRRQLISQIRGLASAKKDLACHDLSTRLPELLQDDDTRIVQSAVGGTFYNPAELSGESLKTAIIAGLEAAAELHRIGHSRTNRIRLPKLPNLSDISIEIPPEGREQLARASEKFLSWFASSRLKSVPTHGDFWLGNLSFEEGLTHVRGIVDWERYDSHGFPLTDAIHLIVISVALHRRVPASLVLPTLWNCCDAYVDSLVGRAAVLFGVSQETFQWMSIAEWLSLIEYGAMEPRPSQFNKWLSDIVSIPGAAMRAWMKKQSISTATSRQLLSSAP